MDIHLHIVSISQAWDCIVNNKGAIVVAWLVAIKVLTAIQDAIDVMPAGLKPPFGRIIYLMKATIPYLGWGNRIKPISETPVIIAPPTAPSSAAPKILSVIFLCITIASFSGCGMIPPHAVNVDIAGHNLETPYGKIEDGSIHIHTIWGAKATSVVIPTASNVGVGTSANASIPVTVTVTPSK